MVRVRATNLVVCPIHSNGSAKVQPIAQLGQVHGFRAFLGMGWKFACLEGHLRCQTGVSSGEFLGKSFPTMDGKAFPLAHESTRSVAWRPKGGADCDCQEGENDGERQDRADLDPDRKSVV